MQGPTKEEMIIDYMVIENTNVEEFENEVKEALYDGYDFCSDLNKIDGTYIVSMRIAKPNEKYFERIQKEQEEARLQAEEAQND